jgi:hypothetical protein
MEAQLLITAQAGFVLLTVIYLALLLNELHRGIQRTTWAPHIKKKTVSRILIILALWILAVSLWSGTGIMGNFTLFPFNFMPVIAIPLVTIIIVLFSKRLKEILHQIPPAHLVRLQSFRFFVEILLWMLFVANIIPEQMTFEGRNFDILSGITAPVIAWLIARGKISRSALIAWNLVCLALLINIVAVAILSTPSPWRIFMNEPANTIVARFPVSWLPGMLVPLAYTLNLLVLKQQWFHTSQPATIPQP